jgi:protein-S-isoprenylcysteine O-methyltransferase Ste14
MRLAGAASPHPVVLLFKNLLFTLVVPGIFVFWLPLRTFERRARWPAEMEPQHWAGLVLAGLGTAAYLHCVWLFMRRGRGTPFLLDPPSHLVQRGLYRWVRNPMYLGVLLVVAAEAVFLRSWHVAIYWVCLACLFQVLVHLYEERDLSFRFGAMYEDYKREVPRWLPRPPRPAPRPVAVDGRER